MDTLFQDLRYALRSLAKSPGFTAVAVLTLALGIGANSSVFTLVNAALFRPIASPHADRLVWLAGTRESSRERRVSLRRQLSYPELRDYQSQLTHIAVLGGHQNVPLALGSGGEPERLNGMIVTSGYFRVLEQRPPLGRFFTTDDDVAGATPVAVLSYHLWQRRFDGAADLLGRDIVVNGRPFTVIGVAPRGFIGSDLGYRVDVWVPLGTAAIVTPDDARFVERRDVGWLRVIGRLTPGATLALADAEARTIAARIVAVHPELERNGVRVIRFAGGLDPGNRQEAVPVFALLMAVPALVLLIACANVANLMLARAATRRREIGIRLALGATRRRLFTQLFTEALVLTVVAGGVGMLLSVWINDLLIAVSHLPEEVSVALTPDIRVLAFTGCVALATGILFGLVPAFRASRPDLVPALKDGGGGPGGQVRRSRLVSGFVVSQMALSLVLLVTAGLFLRTLGKALRVDPGVETTHAVAISFDLRIQGYDASREGAFYTQLLERVRGFPGVTAASLASPMPLGSRLLSSPVAAEGPGDDDVNVQASYAAIWPGYFDAIGAPLVRGRDFTPRDRAGAPPVTIINETMARRLWPGQDPIGKRVRFPSGTEPYLEVVGVARDGKYHELTEEPRPFLYVPERQRADLSDITLLVRTAGDPRPLLPALRETIRSLDPNLPVFQAMTLADALRQRLDKERGASSVLGVFGGLALLLAALGLYGVMAYAVAQRTREVGVRMALGAARGQVLQQFLGEGLRLAAIGVVMGLIIAAALTRVIARFLYGITPTDVLTFALCASLLGAVAVCATVIPARRATRVDPMVALRTE
ncbi:MAG TPA: ABC transporter permease [Gemmatimonadales bacterium]|nr:ABC transporter permease [Gemmatimonadales bacterium]